VWAAWTLFILLSLVGVKLFRRGLAERFRVPGLTPPGLSPVGDRVTIPEALATGGEGRAEFRGASWGVVNRGAEALQAGQRARITAVEGLTLVVEADRQGE
jgi:membrane protein implicated in regulation of membrane protease activity